MPLITTWAEFKPVFYDQLIVNGLLENRKFLEAKIEETKNYIKEQAARPVEKVNSVSNDPSAKTGAPAGENKLASLLGSTAGGDAENKAGIQLKNLGLSAKKEK